MDLTLVPTRPGAVTVGIAKTGRAASFRAVKDPNTGRIDMIPQQVKQFGDESTSPALVAAMGDNRHAEAMGMLRNHLDEDAVFMVPGHRFADVALADMGQLFHGHAREADLAEFAADYLGVVDAIARGQMAGGVVVLDMVDMSNGRKLTVTCEIDPMSVTTVLFCRATGEMLLPPKLVWNDEGEYAEAVREDEPCMPVDEARQADFVTRAAVETLRVAAARPANVLDMAAFRLRRAA